MARIAALFLLAALFSSCSLIVGNQNVSTTPSDLDLNAFQKSYMQSYYSERGGAPTGVAGGARVLTPFTGQVSSLSRATAPINLLGSIPFPSSPRVVTGYYPEPGQTTSFTATLVPDTPDVSKVYDVKVTTTFPTSDLRASYFEEYYVQDVRNADSTADNLWTIDDPIVTKNSGGTWDAPVAGYLTQDPSARISMLLTYRDGSTRVEKIVSSSLSGGPKLDPAAFAVAGSLDMSQSFVPNTTTDPKVVYSSVVYYMLTPSTAYNFWFWSGNQGQAILGIRYYTEELTGSGAGALYTTHTVSFEKALGTLTTASTTFTSMYPAIFVGSQFDTLAESVLRQQVVYSTKAPAYTLPDLSTGQITTMLQSRVVNITGQRDFYITQLNSDAVQLASWASSTIYTPTGNATEILAGDGAAGLLTRTQQITPAAGTLPFAVDGSTVSGLGDLAALYRSITEGALTVGLPPATSPASTLVSGSPNEKYSFNGQQSKGNLVSSPLNLSSRGTVEAWIYIDQHTDTAGIVHKGVSPSFTDECWSLQGWGSAGQIAIVLDQPGGGTSYDSVLSSIKLNTKSWYYIVATWDTTVTPKKIYLYINGALNASGTMNKTASGVRDSGVENDILIGSQLPSSYSSSYGYFGLKGSIVGASASPNVRTASEILTTYNQYKGATSGW